MSTFHIDPENPFADIDESEFEAELAKPSTAPKQTHYSTDIGGVEVPGFTEPCPKCRGTGSYLAVYGRIGYNNDGSCNKCKGTGQLQFKTSPQARAKARKSAKARKARKLEESLAAGLAALPPEVREWLTANQDNTFAASLMAGLAKWGSLTDKQLQAVRNAVARDDDGRAGFEAWAEQHEGVLEWLTSQAEAGNEFANSLLTAGRRYGSLTPRQLAAVQKNLEKAKEEPETHLDLAVLAAGHYAVPDGDTRLKITIRRPGKASRYHGWTFVDDGARYGHRQNYGRQAPGGLYKGRLVEQLQTILADPLEAMVAYGKLTGTCGKCGAPLENEKSIAAGIGPICASRMGG